MLALPSPRARRPTPSPGEQQRPRRRGLRENELEHEADQRQLHHHAQRGDGEAPLQPQPEQPRDRRVDEQQRRRKREVERRQRVRSSCRALSRALECAARGSSRRACARRSIWAMVVADEHDAAPRQDVKLDELLDQRRGLAVECGGRLVEQEHGGVVDQRAHEREALALAGREQRQRAVEGRPARGPAS